ncbi:SDR family NAD(P)-dependent oxidoreductase [Myxococcota bacterium]|nr:SDR family NAD(P)-dependent oxidoreductase [Myxococcota bacterium]
MPPSPPRTAFITGGTAGIGRSLALALAHSGASVVVCARGQSALDETLAALRQANPGGAHGAVSADVADPAAMKAAAAQALSILGEVDLLICNSGFAKAGTVAELDDADFRRLMDVNFYGHVNTVRAFQPHMVARGKGDIVLVSSMLAVLSVYGYAAYSASKFAITGFAQALRQELMLHGVRVKLFLPPTTDTPGLARENQDKPALCLEMEMGSALNATHSPDKVAAAFLKWLPGGRFYGYATWDSWLQFFMAHHFPELTLSLADGELHGARKRLEKKGKG